MFDFAWTEIALIGVVALVAIGPKDLPVAIKTVADLVKKARKMAGEFQTHVDEMVRDANLHEVRDQFNDLRRMDIKGKILEAVDGDRSIRNTIAENPLDQSFIAPAPPAVPVHDLPGETIAAEGVDGAAVEVAERPAVVMGDPVVEPAVLEAGAPPAFIPPAIAAGGMPGPKVLPPAFIPPSVVAGRGLPASQYG